MTTKNEIRIEARGLRCPRPIVELAKARRQAPPGSTVVITADDLAFESDVKAWCETTRNELKKLEREGNVVIATIELMGGI